MYCLSENYNHQTLKQIWNINEPFCPSISVNKALFSPIENLTATIPYLMWKKTKKPLWFASQFVLKYKYPKYFVSQKFNELTLKEIFNKILSGHYFLSNQTFWHIKSNKLLSMHNIERHWPKHAVGTYYFLSVQTQRRIDFTFVATFRYPELSTIHLFFLFVWCRYCSPLWHYQLACSHSNVLPTIPSLAPWQAWPLTGNGQKSFSQKHVLFGYHH